MAFIRWRGGCAQLLTTIYTDKRSKQILLTNLPNFQVTRGTRDEVSRKYPHIKVDWVEVSKVLAQGPPKRMKVKTPEEHLEMAEVEIRLRLWADREEYNADSCCLRRAADALTLIRQRLYFLNLMPKEPRDTDPNCINTPE